MRTSELKNIYAKGGKEWALRRRGIVLKCLCGVAVMGAADLLLRKLRVMRMNFEISRRSETKRCIRSDIRTPHNSRRKLVEKRVVWRLAQVWGKIFRGEPREGNVILSDRKVKGETGGREEKKFNYS